MSKPSFPNNILLLLLFLGLGIILGVIFTRFSYFKIDPLISISDLAIGLLTAIVAIYVVYIASRLTEKITQSQSVKSLYIEDVKSFIQMLDKLEIWVEAGSCNSKEMRKYFKDGTSRLNRLLSVYAKQSVINLDPLRALLPEYNKLKEEITGITPSAQGTEFRFNLGEQQTFGTKIQEIKTLLVDAFVKA